ncbi:MAG TPA: hypothetical protein VEY51_18040, partial [Chondromyces sp.]|nr:hypothetical protein [Chondromyces sp.]
MEIWGLIVIILSLTFLIYLALKGFSIIIIAPLASLIVIFCTNMPVLETIQENYMTGFINFAKNNYLIFLFAAIFGKFMEDSGAAKSIAKGIMRVTGTTKKYNVLLAVVLISAALTYGGVSLFVVIFAVLPIAKPLFRDLQIPWHLFLAAFAFGACTFTMTMLPGTPAIQNVIPTTYFGTDVAAAPLVGFVAAIVVIAINLWYLK